jgi:succinoglycan biosynthesis transport protein ExoP
MQRLLEDASSGATSNGWHPKVSAPPLPEVLWRRRYCLMGCTAVCLTLAAIYLVFATRIYSATARVVVEQNAPRALEESREVMPENDGFLQTQADVITSLPVLSRAYAAAAPRVARTFAAAGKDPLEWLRTGHGINVDLGKKSDVILISMQSPYPQEAVDFANAVVDAYIAEQTQRGQATSDGMLGVLEKERTQKEQERDQLVASMEKYRRDNGILELQDSKGNTILDRASSLSTSLTTVELSVMELKGELAATQKALADPASTAALVESQQEKDRNAGDQELNDLRNERMQYEIALNSSTIIQGARHQHVQILISTLDAINNSIAAKERSMAEGMLASVQARLTAAQQQEDDVRAALQKQTATALGLSPETYANAQADVARLQKSLDVLDGRITELSVNKTTDMGPLSISVMEQATLEERPIKPSKSLILAAAMLVGIISGAGLAIARENMDLRLRSPHEVRSLLSLRVIASVPLIAEEMSAVARGQIVRLDAQSAVAEAYRSIRTVLHLGTKMAGKTILLVSPSAGEGKSTTASNIALSFAQAGERTLLIDCDLREPVQHLIFEMDTKAGLSDVIAGSARLGDAVQETEMPGLFLLPCGTIPANPSELLASKRFTQLMQTLSKTFDRIIIDSPPLMNVTDGCILAAAADVTLLVLKMSGSTRETALTALDELDRVGANVLGVVANGVQLPRAYRYYGSASKLVTRENRRLEFANGSAANGKPTSAIQSAPTTNGRRARSEEKALLIEEPEWALD